MEKDGFGHMEILPVTGDNAREWAVLCSELWPHHGGDAMLEGFGRGAYPHEYLARIDGIYAAFISLSLRTDYVEGREGDGPVGYLEGIYVRPSFRRKGVARGLVHFARRWARAQGCTQFASDCELCNEDSRRFHQHIGFAQAGINVHFILSLAGDDAPG